MIRPELREITVTAFTRALELDGFAWTAGTSRLRVFRHGDGRRVVVSGCTTNDTFPDATLAEMLRATGWGGDDLRRLGLLPNRPATRV
jgi:predicted RNA binding protein YcfA (HicA-like mRNA interferase family)